MKNDLEQVIYIFDNRFFFFLENITVVNVIFVQIVVNNKRERIYIARICRKKNECYKNITEILKIGDRFKIY